MAFFKIDYNPQERIFGLDLLRTVAVLLVVLGHGEAIVRDNFPNYIHFWIIDGVDLFFVLSGFLIGSIVIKSFEKSGVNRRAIVVFWKRRWFRTLPNYYLILIISLIYSYISIHSFDGFSSDYILFLQNFRNAHPNFLPVAWSLAIEEWFYFLFPIVVIIISRIFSRLTVKKIFLITICLFLLLPLLYRIKRAYFLLGNPGDWIWEDLFRKTVITRLDTIVFGVFGAYLNFYYSKIWSCFRYVKFVIGIVLIYIAQYKLNAGILHFTLYFDVLSLGVLLLIPLLNSIRTANKYLSLPITYISLASYSLYLIHFSLILDPILRYFKPYSDLGSLFFYALYLSLSVLVSITLYKYFENPAMNLRDKIYKF